MKAAICAIIKDEHRYLKEWIDYHLGIGFSHIYLFEDYGSKSHEEIVRGNERVTLKTLSDVGIGEERWGDGKACMRQQTLYDFAIKEYKGHVDWLALIDADEFVEFEEGYCLEKLLKEFNDKSGLFLYWKVITASGNVKYEDKPVRERFTKIGPPLDNDTCWQLKSFVNLNVNTNGMISIHECSGLWNTMGICTPRIVCHRKAWLNHYFTKSWEEWCYRFIKRGESSWGHRQLHDFFRMNPDMLERKYEMMDMYYRLQSEYFRNEKKDAVIKVQCNGRFANQLYEAAYAISVYGLNQKYDFVNADNQLVDILKANGVNICNDKEADAVVNGYNQTWKYIDWDIARSIFKCPISYKNAIEEKYPAIKEMVVCHVRRGDYLDDCYKDRFRILTKEYIANVREKHFDNTPMLVVSDDILWCKKNINNALFSNGDTLFDFYCLVMAGGIISSASTFSIMASCLNDTAKSVIPYPLYDEKGKKIDSYMCEIENKICPPYSIREKL